MIRQSLVNVWLDGWKLILRQLWTLERTYGGPEIWFRVTSNEQGVQLLMDEAAIMDFQHTDLTDNPHKLAKLAGEIAAIDRVLRVLQDD